MLHTYAPARRLRAARAESAEVAIVLQPIIDLASGALVACEALARFPTNQSLPVPTHFEVARANGRGPDLEATCLRAALQRRAHLPAGVRMSVNVSPDALSHPHVQQALAGDLDGVIVEVTEHEGTDPVQLQRSLHELRDRGALIAIDDASTVYAGLLRLSRLRPDLVKLDRSLVSGAADSVEQSAVIEALVSLSRRIGAGVLGEGVESIDDLRTLVDLDVDLAQGWVVARPDVDVLAPEGTAVEACVAARRALLRSPAPICVAPPDESQVDLHQVTAALAASVNVGDLRATLLRASTTLGVDIIGLSTLSDGQLREIAAAGAAVDESSYPIAMFPATRDALLTGTMVEIHVDDPSSDAAERDLLAEQHLASLLMAPLIRDGVPLGILEFSHRSKRRWTSHDIRQAHTMADHVIHVLLRLNCTP